MKSIDFLTTIVSALVDFPNEVKITEKVDEYGTLLSVEAAQSDMGKIIGRDGMTAKAIKHIVNCQAFSQGSRVAVKILDPQH